MMKSVISVGASLLFAYLLGAFICWDFDAGTWGETARFSIVILGVAWGMLTVSYIEAKELSV